MKLTTQYAAMKYLDENRENVRGKTVTQIRQIVCDNCCHISLGQARRYSKILEIETKHATEGGLTSRMKRLHDDMEALRVDVRNLENELETTQRKISFIESLAPRAGGTH